MYTKVEEFRCTILSWIVPFFWVCAISGIVLFLVIIIGHKQIDLLTALKAVLIFEGVVSGVLVLVFAPPTFTHPVEIFNEGISSYDPFSWSRKDFLEWSSIESIRYKNIFGVKYLVLESLTHSKKVLLPLKLKNRERFARVISELAGENHILSVELERIATGSARTADK